MTPQNNPDSTGNRGENMSDKPIRVTVESFPPKPTPSQEYDAEKTLEKRLKFGLAILEVLALVALLAYVCETRRTNNLTQTALDTSKEQFTKSQQLSKEQFRQDQRPYIWMAVGTKDSLNLNLEILNFMDSKGKKLHQIAVTMPLTNFGKSPAIFTRHYHGMKLGNENESFTYIPHWLNATRVMPPGKVDNFSTQSDYLTDTQLLDYTKKPYRSGIKIFATWQYSDSGGHTYETEICMGRLNLGGWAYCPDHNEIKDCAEKTCEP